MEGLDTDLEYIEVTVADEFPSGSELTSVCAICLHPAHGIHFGVMTCRACAAFFRRTVVLDKKYACKQNDGKCDFGPEIRQICRACRYDKCLEVGMTADNVQWNRDRLCNATRMDTLEKSDGGRTIEDPHPTDYPPQQTTIVHRPIPSLPNPVLSPELALANLKAPKAKRPVPPHLLELINELQEVPKMLERIFMQTAPMEVISPFPLTALQRMAVATERMRGPLPTNPPACHNIEMEFFLRSIIKKKRQAAEWMMHCEEFARLPLEEKLKIYETACMYLARLEKVAQPLTVFGVEAINNRWMLMADRLITPFTMFNVAGLSDYSNEEIMRFFHPHMESMFEDLGRPLAEVAPAPLEYIYILCSTMWNVDGQNVMPETLRVADLYRERISAELHDYYVHSRGMENYAHRLMQLRSVMNANDRHQQERSDLFFLFQLFDVFYIDIPLCGGKDTNKI
ncbi:unnamed protein product, partial [Mesorhabditis spiculigera]